MSSAPSNAAGESGHRDPIATSSTPATAPSLPTPTAPVSDPALASPLDTSRPIGVSSTDPISDPLTSASPSTFAPAVAVPVDAQHTGGSRPASAGKSESSEPPKPMCHLRVLLISGEYHVFSFEPETPIGRLKELIWSMWPSDWTEPAQPPSPAYLRVLYAGRILADESTLTSNNVPSALAPATPTVVHLSVRNFSIAPEDVDAKKGNLQQTASRQRATDEVSGCKCIIM